MLRYGTVRTRRGNTIAFAVHGSGDTAGRAPIFLVHPINLRKECWLDLVPALAGDRPCVAVDLAGHGESTDDDEFTLDGWLADCVDVVAALGLERFHAVGGSLGGTIALCLAAELPANVLSVTAMGGDLGDEPVTDPAIGDEADVGSVEDLFAGLAVAALAPGAPASLVTTVRHLTNTHGMPIVAGVLRAAEAADAMAWVPRVRCPVLVLTGEFDTTATPDAGERMAEAVGGRHVVLRDVGHLPMLESVTAVVGELLPHLAGAERPHPAGGE
ncbi:MAG TPA: alpha/beta hydrolase [Nonomuraea sp.]|nr:alpha/beta hydrolase [Nonomuraea sp.]